MCQYEMWMVVVDAWEGRADAEGHSDGSVAGETSVRRYGRASRGE